MAYKIHGSQSRVHMLPIDGNGTDIAEGTFLVAGTTADQDESVLIGAPGAGSTVPENIVGILNKLHDFSVDGDSDPEASSPDHVLQPVDIILPGDEVAIEYNTAVTVDVASGTTTATTITSLEDRYDGGWVYMVSGTAVGELAYCRASASGSVTHPTLTTASDSTTKAILITPCFQLIVALSALSATVPSMINSYAAVTNYVLEFMALRNQLTYNGKNGWETMRPDRHNNLQLSGLSAKFRAVGFLRDLAAGGLD